MGKNGWGLTTDLVIRAVVGALPIIRAARGGNWVVGVIGAVLVGTAYLRFRRAYKALDFARLFLSALDLTRLLRGGILDESIHVFFKPL